ncbi:hypothetical protein FOMA001_g1825 [Fusarium oxysporum f. sp. matthiolae]|nr:hypothetical protein FOMA001_g1825 [Fusarium oxysporum f. sp. matthiolae]
MAADAYIAYFTAPAQRFENQSSHRQEVKATKSNFFAQKNSQKNIIITQLNSTNHQQHSTLISTVTRMKISDLENPGDPDPNEVAKEYIKSLQRNNDTETSTDPDPNVTAEEPIENVPDPEPSQAESSEAQNTGSDQGVPECRISGCRGPAARGLKSCEEHLKRSNELTKSAKRNLQIRMKSSFN